MSIRTYIEEDLPAILSIYARSKLDELANEEQEFNVVPLENDADRFASLRESKIFVYEEQRVFGFGALHNSEIRFLFVHPDARGKGIGETLLQYLLSLAPRPVSLQVAKTNYNAKSLYSKHGFRTTEEYQTKYDEKLVFANKMVLG